MKKYNNGELEEHYKKAEQADHAVYAEMRSNALLVSGDHYKKTGDLFRDRFRETSAPQDQKLRLVRNHVGSIVKAYTNSIVSASPSVRVQPFNPSEMQDVASAQLNQSVWQAAMYKHKLSQRFSEWCENFVTFGEVVLYLRWDQNRGDFLGYEQAVDEMGNPLFQTPDGQMVPMPQDPLTGEMFEPAKSNKAVFEGDIAIETVCPFNLLRDPNAESIAESPWVIIRKMVPLDEAKKMIAHLPEQEREDKGKYIQESSETTYKVFDANRGEYIDGKGQVMIKTHLFRPCAAYPEGYYYVRTAQGILFEGPLPFGIWPLVFQTFDKIPTTARGRSIIKQLRPYAAEINRCASSIATHQLVLGDDKVFTQYNAKISKGIQLPGLRHYTVNGNPPTIVQGRDGSQFFAYLSATIEEMYQVAGVSQLLEDKGQTQDPQAMMYQSLKQKRVFTLYAERFESFLCDFCELFLSMARAYYPDSKTIKAIGRNEIVNIAEWKATSPKDYRIKVEPMSQDLDSMFGRLLNLQYIMQYLGKDLGDDVKGKVIRALPFLNTEEIFDDLTVDEDNVKADLLSLDRGEIVEPDDADDAELYIKRLRHRMKKADFRYLPPHVQRNYMNLIEQYKEIQAMQAQKLKEAQESLIPASGPLAKCDLYVSKANGKGTERAVMPADALMWLKKRLDEQGLTQDVLQQFAVQDAVDMAQMAGFTGMEPQDPGMMPQEGMDTQLPVPSDFGDQGPLM